MDRSTEFSREFGRRVREKRMALGMPQHTLADRLGMKEGRQGHISRMEKGEFIFMNTQRLAELAAVLHTSVDYLLARTDREWPRTAREPVSVGD